MEMKHATRHIRNERGSTLVGVMILAIIMLMTMAAVFDFGAQDATLANHEIRYSQALYLAESGLAKTVAWLEAQDDPPYQMMEFQPFGETPDSTCSGTYAVSIVPDAGNAGRSTKYYTIRSSGTVGDVTRTLEHEVRTQSFAQFIYFTHEEHPPSSTTPVWFCSADHLDGAIHSNGQFHIFGDPYFGGHLSSAYGGPDDDDWSHNPSLMYYNGSYSDHIESTEPSNPPHDEPTFEDGFELGTTEIELPDCLDDLEAWAQDGGLYLDGNSKIVLSRTTRNGTLWGYISYKIGSARRWTNVPLDTLNGVVFVDGTAKVEGILDGSLTIASSGDMYITDDVTYRDSDSGGPCEGCDDILGLVSESDIIIKDNSDNRDDCVIHAHLMALGTSFGAQNYSSGSPRGTLTVHGGIIQQYRGCVGTGSLNGDQVIIRTGYAKDYHYDHRFESVQPPGYLLTGEYHRMRWKEV